MYIRESASIKPPAPLILYLGEMLISRIQGFSLRSSIMSNPNNSWQLWLRGEGFFLLIPLPCLQLSRTRYTVSSWLIVANPCLPIYQCLEVTSMFMTASKKKMSAMDTI